MSDFPNALPAGATGALSWWCGGGVGIYDGGFNSQTGYTANAAIFTQVFTSVPQTVYGFGWSNGSAVSGNIDCGLYDKNGVRLGHTGSVAQAGTSAAQVAAVSGGSFAIAPGNYYVALAIDNGTGAIIASTAMPAIALQQLGVFGMASAFPLPATATFASPTQTKLPLFAAFTTGSTF